MKRSSKNILIQILLVTLPLWSCEEPDLEFKYNSTIVVDGWIENGEFAHVLLTRTTPFFTTIDSNSYIDMVETFASVSITNGEETEFLTLTRDKSLFPRHVYKTTSMKGVVGETYLLRVKMYDTILTATTTITEPAVIDSVWFEPLPENDTVGTINLMFTDNAETKNYYRVLAKTDKDTRFEPIMASAIDDKDFIKPINTWPILKGRLTQIDHVEELYFKRGETVTIKLCSIEKPVFDFWRNYQVESLNAANPFASSGTNLTGNVEGKGLGIWSGEGTVYRRFKIE